MPGPRGFELTRHAQQQVVRRGIDPAWVQRAIDPPTDTVVDRDDERTLHVFATIPEAGGRVLRVIYNNRNDVPRVVTAFFDRRMRPKP